jgi:hypothetical protein
VKKTKVVNMTLDEDEYDLFIEAMIEYENTIQKRVSVGKFMRDIFIPMLKEDNKPSAYDEIFKHRNGHNPKIVFQPPSQPVSEQKNKENPIQVSQTVSENVSKDIWDSDFLESFTDK